MSLEVVCGPMFSGKSSYIYSIVKRYASIGLRSLVIKPTSDIRYSDKPEVVTHDGVKFDCISIVGHLMNIDHSATNNVTVIIIEEAQFFDDLIIFSRTMVDNFGKDVVIVGLDGDSDRKPFGQLLDCIPLADRVTKLSAFCTKCADGTQAIFTFRKVKKSGQVLVGGHDSYEPYCRTCYLNAIQESS
jgi:thymidine kinase